jgi:hypothetical protein
MQALLPAKLAVAASVGSFCAAIAANVSAAPRGSPRSIAAKASSSV